MADHLDIRTGFFSAQGRRARNEDYGGAWLGTPAQRARYGAVAALADGVGGAKGGRVAAEIAVKSFIDGYLSLPETLGVRRVSARSIEAVNRWIFAQGRTDPALEGMATTLTALILRGRQAHILHVGDTRLYRVRDGEIALLTEDHTSDRPDLSHILQRAIGAEDGIRADYHVEAVQLDDRFLLCTDGIHGTLRNRQILDVLASSGAPDEAARSLVESALANGSQDNATALILDVVGLPATAHIELQEAIGALPILEPPRSGEIIDNYQLDEILSDGNYTRLFKATDKGDGREIVIKFPKPDTAQEPTFRIAFLREIWIPSRIRSPWVGEAIEPAPGRQTRLYSIMPFYDGETLERRLTRAPRLSVAEGLPIAIKLAKAVAALHRAGIIHRDIKPDNVILQDGGGLRLIDLGVAHLPRLEDFPSADMPGTASYMAPELFDGQQSDERSDLYSLGVTIYRMFSGGAYPYGEIEPFSRPRFGRPAALARLRPDLPVWLEPIIAKSITVAAGERYADVVELAFELENGLARGAVSPRRPRPLYDRNKLLFWQILALVLLILLLASLSRR